MKKSILLALLLCGSAAVAHAQWGDQGNGTYINPILNADYSDPDVIRVGERYYMVASDFHFIGMQILESDDMVNWRLVTQVYKRFDLPGWDSNQHYAGGSWAPAIRHHNGKFYIYFCTPDEGLFMTESERPEGPWSPLLQVKAIKGWEDPCPFWDEDGQAYLGHSKVGAGPIIIHKMSPDGHKLLDDGLTVYTGPVAEGTKFLKRGGWYYLSIPEGGVEPGWQTVLRSKNIYGPYEKKVVLEQGSTPVNGPHQGSIVDTPQGEWWFYHFQHTGSLGRVVHLQPMRWQDEWPVIGVDIDRNGIGEPVAVWTKPIPSEKAFLPQTSDDFEAADLSPQWQWNHNPVNEAWSLSEHKGALTLHALQAEKFSLARNTLTQKAMGYQSQATLALEAGAMAEDGRAGLVCMGSQNVLLGICRRGGRSIIYRGDGKEETELAQLKGKVVYLRLTLDVRGRNYQLSYSTDNKRFTQAGEPFFVDFGYWKGVRFGIYHYNTQQAQGYVTIPWVNYEVDAEKALRLPK